MLSISNFSHKLPMTETEESSVHMKVNSITPSLLGGSNNRSIASLLLPPSLISALKAGGFTDTEDLVDISPHELSRELKISIENALTVLTQAKSCNLQPQGTSCIDLLKNVPSEDIQQSASLVVNLPMNLPIITFCRELDSMMGGGVSCGQVTELCGVPGIGESMLPENICTSNSSRSYHLLLQGRVGDCSALARCFPSWRVLVCPSLVCVYMYLCREDSNGNAAGVGCPDPVSIPRLRGRGRIHRH